MHVFMNVVECPQRGALAATQRPSSKQYITWNCQTENQDEFQVSLLDSTPFIALTPEF